MIAGISMVIRRRADGLLDCPCGEPLHRRYSHKVINRLAHADAPHPPPICTDKNHLDVPRTVEPSHQSPSLQPSTSVAAIEGSEPDFPHRSVTPPHLQGEDVVMDPTPSSTTQQIAPPLAPAAYVEGSEEHDESRGPSTDDRQDDPMDASDSDEDLERESEGPAIDESSDDPDLDDAENSKEQPHLVETHAAASALLESCGLYVDATYRAIICIDCHVVLTFRLAYTHRAQKHKPHHQLHGKKVGRSKVQACLEQLRAHIPKFPSPDSLGIPPIEHLKVESYWGCGVAGCSYNRLWPSDAYCRRRHSNPSHADLPLPERTPVRIPGHCFDSTKATGLYVRVLKSGSAHHRDLAGDDPLSLILRHSEMKGIGVKKKKLAISNKREVGAVLYQSNWIPMLADVPLDQLMAQAAKPKKDELELCRLRDLMRLYYNEAPAKIPTIDQTTRAQIKTHHTHL